MNHLSIMITTTTIYQTEQANKLQNMDESEINDLALELEGPAGGGDKDKMKSLQQKKKARAVEARLAAEKKKKNKKSNDDDDDDDDADYTTFAKGSRPTKKKN